MADKFQLEIATPERLLIREQVSEAQVPAANGYLGVLPGHAPLLCKLGVGLLRFHDASLAERRLFIEGGFGHVRDNEVTILSRG
ncbi:MAG: F0F1 ATP synthase subunit epsilon, partial [Acidobacteria bacterium]|nr:F0F1 ATP synthase subunit epsilon [Acidobacteriota bacterium]